MVRSRSRERRGREMLDELRFFSYAAGAGCRLFYIGFKELREHVSSPAWWSAFDDKAFLLVVLSRQFHQLLEASPTAIKMGTQQCALNGCIFANASVWASVGQIESAASDDQIMLKVPGMDKRARPIESLILPAPSVSSSELSL